MLRDMLSHRAIQAGLIFVLLVVCGSLMYSWQVERTLQTEAARDAAFRRRLQLDKAEIEIQPTAGTFSTDTERSEGIAPLETETTENAAEGIGPFENDPIDAGDVLLTDASVSEDTPAEDIPVSPFGFGPYPEVPVDYKKTPSWLWSEEKKRDFAGGLSDIELIDRVLIKLWNRGDRDWVGAKLDDRNGRVYPLYRNLIYVTRWEEIPVKGGKTALYPAGGASGGHDWDPHIIKFIESGGHIPDHIQFMDEATAGYNPYEFLNLK